MKIEKVIRNGRVGILLSCNGWYTRNNKCIQMLFSPLIIDLVEKNKHNEITNKLCIELFKTYNYIPLSAIQSLQIYWLKEGTKFTITHDNMFEYIITENMLNITA